MSGKLYFLEVFFTKRPPPDAPVFAECSVLMRRLGRCLVPGWSLPSLCSWAAAWTLQHSGSSTLQLLLFSNIVYISRISFPSNLMISKWQKVDNRPIFCLWEISAMCLCHPDNDWEEVWGAAVLHCVLTWPPFSLIQSKGKGRVLVYVYQKGNP